MDLSCQAMAQECGLREIIRVRPRDGRFETVSGGDAVRAILALIDEDADCFDPRNGHRYRKLGAQLADVSLVFLAERKGLDTVFTLDRRAFTLSRYSKNKPSNSFQDPHEAGL